MKKKTINKEIFAKRLADLMEEFGETTYTMADRFSLTSPTISRYMTGQMAAKVTTIELMANYFNVNPVWLMGYDVEKTSPCLKSAIKLTEHERKVIIAYREQPETQPFVDKLLNVKPEVTKEQNKNENKSPDNAADYEYSDLEPKQAPLRAAQDSEEYK